MSIRCFVQSGLLLAALLYFSMPVRAGDDLVFSDGFDPAPAILVQTPQIVIGPGEAVTLCYYFRASNTSQAAIRKWSSSMGAGVHHLILYASYDNNWTPAERQPPGTLTQSPCGLGDGGGIAAWLYAAHDPVAELVFPSTDGAGLPLGVDVEANQPLFLQMYLINPGDSSLSTSVLLKGEALAPATAYTKSATYLLTNFNFAIPPGASGYTVEQTCQVPSASKFWWLSTRTHHFAVLSKIRNAGADVVVSTDWEHPTVLLPPPPAFFQFSPSGMTYQCVYDNPGSSTIQSGESESSNEACIGIGYFFPATRPAVCFNNVGPL